MINDRLRVKENRLKPYESQLSNLTERMDSWKDSLNKYADAVPLHDLTKSESRIHDPTKYDSYAGYVGPEASMRRDV